MLGDSDGPGLFQNVDPVVGLEPQDGQALDVDLGNTRFLELHVLVSWFGDFQRPESVGGLGSRETGAVYCEGSVVGVVDASYDRFGQPCRDVREVWVVLTKVGDAGVL